MLKITIELDGEDLYEIEAHDQSPEVSGITPHAVLINDEEVGQVHHDKEDGPWMLARHILNTFPATETLREQDGGHTAFHDRVYGWASASARLTRDGNQ